MLREPWSLQQLDLLASHLTIGETYFFRDRACFDALAEHALPALIRARRNGEKRLRLWSAGCCTGEEAYSLAILVQQVLPDAEQWQVSILGTDIHPGFLRKAAEGVYGEWSLRGSSDRFKLRYFSRTGDGHYQITDSIRRMVQFAPLNLAQPGYPSLVPATDGIDLILCRNVLMYFSAAQFQAAVARLHQCLAPDGWLAVSASEVSRSQFPAFDEVRGSGALLYRRRDGPAAPSEVASVAANEASAAADGDSPALPLPPALTLTAVQPIALVPRPSTLTLTPVVLCTKARKFGRASTRRKGSAAYI